MSELDALEVHGETEVGWCERTPTNETMDADGNTSVSQLGFSAGDPRAPRRRVYDDPEVCKLRDHLRANNGIRGLEICEPDELERVARIFHRDGFVVVRDLLDAETLARWREGCARQLRKILDLPGPDGRKYLTETSRLPHRYSYGTASASRQLLHDPAWASMIDLPTTTPILIELFGSDAYHVLGAGGDLCLPGAIEYQTLHSDLQESCRMSEARVEQAKRLGIELKTLKDSDELHPRTQQTIVARTPPLITINFAMSDLTWENGPIRQIPGTHKTGDPPPSQPDEPEWMRLSTLVGAPAGAGVFRDNRAWHGATPNLSREIRALPNVEYGAPWLPTDRTAKTMPHEVWESLSPHAQKICFHVKAAQGTWPEGAGVMHPLLSGRRTANDTSPGIANEK